MEGLRELQVLNDEVGRGWVGRGGVGVTWSGWGVRGARQPGVGESG